MRSLSRGLLCAVCCMSLNVLSSPLMQAQAAVRAESTSAENQQRAASAEPVASSEGAFTASAELPDSPSSSSAQDQDTSSAQTGPAVPADQTKSQSSTQANTQKDQKLQRPVGTAAAEAPKVSGITAAEPAGIAIAPAKQHRVRTIVIKVGAIIGAGAALGTVIALTAATPSKPPGAH
jgi:cytoskeletal protein RodZ